MRGRPLGEMKMAWIVSANGNDKIVRTEKKAIEVGKLISEFYHGTVEAYPIFNDVNESHAYYFEWGDCHRCTCYSVPRYENDRLVGFSTCVDSPYNI